MPKVVCQCGKAYQVSDEDAKTGKTFVCKACGAKFTAARASESRASLEKVAAAPSGVQAWSDVELAKIDKLKKAHDTIVGEIHKAVVGQEQVVKELMTALFAQGHCLLMGVPGLGKTLLVRTLASSLSLDFKRVQFTPDLMPSDITGTEVIQENKETGERVFRFIKGPIFTNILLADEINRTPPKTQASLLEAMQEKQVTVGGERHNLSLPFFVLATQNPIEQEGTYPLPEAQLDRFMFLINVGYPTEDEEMQILEMTTAGYEAKIEPALAAQEILELQRLVRRVFISQDIMRAIVRMVRKTRTTEKEAPDFIKKWVTWGAGPRACQNLVLGAKSTAVLSGRHEVIMEDVLAVAKPVMGHRIMVNFAAQSEGMNAYNVVDELLKAAV
jgi:MoxR-like ATPase